MKTVSPISPRRRPPWLHLKRHLLDSLALSTTITLIYSSIELFLLGLSALVSARARVLVVVAVFCGLGSLVARGRDVSLRFIGLTASSRESSRLTHDIVFNALANALIAPVFYVLAGANLGDTARATLTSVAVSAASGPVNGLMIDLYRHWAGIPSSDGRFSMRRVTVATGLFIWLASGLVLAVVSTMYWVVG